MATIDERVVSMKFNNGQFQKAVQATLDGLATLKSSLNFTGAKNGLSTLSDAAKSVNLQPMVDGIDRATKGFDNMKVVGLAALATLASKATSAGIEMGKNLVNNAFLKAPKDGLAEYETKIGSIQTILANTSKHGTKLKDVNKALEELNTYSDDTIYNFGDMTRNIGFFTNAGIGLKEATSMIKGFSNEAASSGTNAQQAAGAAYQLSQALSSGKVTLMDWKSLTNVGMGSANMKDGIIQIAQAMGTLKEKGVSANSLQKDFNATLEKGWLTADVMQKYLQIQAGDLSKAQIKAIGLSDKQADALIKQSEVAEDAARKVRTLTQLLGTYAETVGSGWAKSWEIVFGDFNEATDLFSGISEKINGFAEASAEARNSVLQSWKDMGGRTALVKGLMNLFEALESVMKPIKKAWAEVFPPSGANGLVVITKAFENFTKLLILGDGQASALGATFKLFFNILKIGMQIIGGVFIVLGKLLEAIFTGGKGLEGASQGVADFFNKISDAISNSQWITTFFETLGSLISAPIPYLIQFGGALVEAFANSALVRGFGDALVWVSQNIGNLGQAVTDGLKWFVDGTIGTVFTRVIERVKSFGDLGDKLNVIFDELAGVFRRLMQIMQPVFDALGQMAQDIGKNINDVFTNVNFDTGLDILNTGLLAGLVLLIRNFFKNVLGMGDGVKEDLLGKVDDLVGGLKEIMGGLTDTLSAMQASIKADTILKIAGAIAILTASILVLSLIDSDKLTAALIAMSTMFVQLGVTMKVLTLSMAGVDMGAMVGLGAALMLLSGAILILSFAVSKLSKLNWEELAKGLTGVVVLLIALTKASQTMGKNAANLVATGVGLIAVAIGINILASAVKKLADLNFGELMKGLLGVGTLLAGLALFTKFAKVNKGAMANATGLILLGVAIKILASAVRDFAEMSIGDLIQGMTTLALVLSLLSGFGNSMGNLKGLVAAGTSMILLSVGINILALALGTMGRIPIKELIKGLIGLGGALAIVTIAMNLLPKGGGAIASAAALVIVSAALVILAGALRIMGSMDMAGIGKAMLLLVVSLAAIAGAMYVMVGAIPGAIALMIVAAALNMLAPVLILLGSIPFETILQGLGALVIVLVALGGVGALLGLLAPLMSAFGTALILVGVGVLAVGAGFFLMATAIGVLAAIGAAAIPTLIELIKSLADTFPYVAQKFGEALVAFATVMAESIPTLIEGFKALILALLEALTEMLPPLFEFVKLVLDQLIQLLIEFVPKLVDMGMKLIVGILQGIRDNIGDLVTAGIDIVVNLINGIASRIGAVIDAGVNLIISVLDGIARNIPRIAEAGTDVIIAFIQAISDESVRVIDAGVQAVIDFVNGVATSIETHAGEMREAGKRLAFAIADGMTGGLASKVGDIAAKAREMASSALGAAKSFLGIASPSKEFKKIGRFTGDGFVIGMNDRANDVQRSASSLGMNALNGVKSAMSQVRDAVSGNIDASPTIKPVLDLTDIQNKAGQIGSILPKNALSADLSLNRASDISNRRAEMSAEDLKNMGNANAKSVNINMVQNNTSPKSLSESEIYRQTKNQLSQAKELANA